MVYSIHPLLVPLEGVTITYPLGKKGRGREEEGRREGKKERGKKGNKLKNGRAGKEIKIVATLYTPAHFSWIL